MRRAVKTLLNWLCVLLVFPAALLAGFGRFKPGFDFFAQLFALAPGIPGVFVRRAYYFLSLESCSLECVMPFGVLCTRRATVIEPHVSFGPNAVIGSAHIGHHALIGGNTQMLSGRHHHVRDEKGDLIVPEESSFKINVGPNAWIGTSCVVMADVGEGTTIGAGSVVVDPIPDNVLAVGAPARVVKELSLSDRKPN